jgi:hypothetical protein
MERECVELQFKPHYAGSAFPNDWLILPPSRLAVVNEQRSTDGGARDRAHCDEAQVTLLQLALGHFKLSTRRTSYEPREVFVSQIRREGMQTGRVARAANMLKPGRKTAKAPRTPREKREEFNSWRPWRLGGWRFSGDSTCSVL